MYGTYFIVYKLKQIDKSGCDIHCFQMLWTLRKTGKLFSSKEGGLVGKT